MERRVLTLFVASPSDLADERLALRDEVERVDKLVARRLGWHVELTGWEDARPGYARPQELINKDVDACDLFIGMLWKRWGQPTGKYGSGFEEEFFRARDRRQSTGKPEIWLHFKALKDSEKVDPGEQLQKVLGFRKDQEEIKELLFKEFSDPGDLSNIARESLVGYLFDLSQSPPKLTSQDRALPIQPKANQTKKTRGKRERSRKNAKALLNDLPKLLARARKAVSGKNTLDISERARLLLLSTAWYSAAHDSELIGVHELNLAYAKRTSWALSNDEINLACRTMIADTNTVSPAWFWLTMFPKRQHLTTTLLSHYGTRDGNPAVRAGAFSILAQCASEIELPILEEGLRDPVTIDPAIGLARRLAREEFIPLLSAVADNTESKKRSDVLDVLIEIICRKNQDDAFTLLLSRGDRVPRLLKDLEKHGQLRISKPLLEEAVTKAAPTIREFAAGVLRSARQLSADMANALLNDPDQRVRKVGVLALFDLGQPLSMSTIKSLFPDRGQSGAAASLIALGTLDVDPDDFLPLTLDGLSLDDLSSKVNFYTADGVGAYWVIAHKYFKQAESRIRSDLKDNFEGVRRSTEERFAAQHGESARDTFRTWKPSTIQFVRNQFRDAALSGVAENANSEDAPFARNVLKEPKLPPEIASSAISILSKFGTPADVDILLAATEKTYGDARRLAIETVLRLASNEFDVASKLVLHNDADVRRAAARVLLTHDWTATQLLARDLLLNESAPIRELGIALYLVSAEDSELLNVLDTYLKRDTYYYNVVTWLDRILYAPEPFRSAFRTELRGIVFGAPSASEE